MTDTSSNSASSSNVAQAHIEPIDPYRSDENDQLIKSITVLSTGSGEAHPEHQRGTWLPLWWWVLTSQRWMDIPIHFFVIEHRDGLILFDAVFDAVGKTTYGQCRRLMKPTARFAATDLGPWWQNIWLSVWYRLTRSRRVNIPFPVSRQNFVDDMSKLMNSGALRAVVDRIYPLEAIADAHRYVRQGQKTGIVVIDLESN